MYIYLLMLLALTTMMFIWSVFRLMKISGDISDTMKELEPALGKRNVAALDLVRTAENVLSPENSLINNIRKYGRLSAGASSFKEKALNAALLQNSLAELLAEMSDNYPETVRESGFISSFVELQKAEDLIGGSARKYNSLVSKFNGMLSGPFMKLLARLLRIPEIGHFPEQGSPLPKLPTQDPSPRDRARDLADVLISNIGAGSAMKCRCGLEISIPPDFKEEKIFCQMCGESHKIPSQLTRAAEAMLKGDTFFESARHAAGTGRGWGSLRCTCGNVTQLSPGFEASYVKCFSCGRKMMSGSGNEKPVPVSPGTK